VLEDVSTLVAAEPVADPDARHACPRARDVELDELGPIREQRRGRPLQSGAVGEQDVAEPRAPIVKIAVAQATLAVDDRDPVRRRPEGALVEPLRGQHARASAVAASSTSSASVSTTP